MSDLESDIRIGSISKDQSPRIRPKKSNIWRKFTIVSHKNSIASCDICGCKLSYKTTVTNLKKHMIRKHSYDVVNSCLIPLKPKAKKVGLVSTPDVSSLGLEGLEGLILNVVTDEGENQIEQSGENGGEITEIYHENEMHNYCDMSRRHEEVQAKISSVPKSYHSKNTKDMEEMDRIKKSRILDLQLECLEIKKYTMQMEALMLENQLNLPRSIFTEPLRRNDIFSRGTQTDIGGNNTKVFYVSDSNVSKESIQHFFTFRASLNE